MTLALPLERSHVSAQLARLLRVFKKPEQAPVDDVEFATDYAQLCGDLTPEQFAGAVDAYLRSGAKWFPKPGELLGLGRAIARGPNGVSGLAGEYAEWERAGWQDPVTGRWSPCPVCGAEMGAHVVRIAPNGEQVHRFLVLHNAAVHWKVGVGFTMQAMPGTGGGRYEHRIVDQRPRVVSAPAAPEANLERAAIQAEGNA